MFYTKKKSIKSKHQGVLENVKKSVGSHAFKYGVKAAQVWGKKPYPQFSSKRETVRDWKYKYQKHCKEQEPYVCYPM